MSPADLFLSTPDLDQACARGLRRGRKGGWRHSEPKLLRSPTKRNSESPPISTQPSAAQSAALHGKRLFRWSPFRTVGIVSLSVCGVRNGCDGQGERSPVVAPSPASDLAH